MKKKQKTSGYDKTREKNWIRHILRGERILKDLITERMNRKHLRVRRTKDHHVAGMKRRILCRDEEESREE